MSEKKYLLTAIEMCDYGLVITGNAGLDCMETLEFIDRFLAAHEYRERTCRPVIEDETEVCSNCGEDIDGYGWSYCPNCGAKVVE